MAMAGQTHAQRSKIYTSDIQHFWESYDHVKKVTDTAEQRKIIQAQYLDRGTDGLMNFIKLRGWTADKFRESFTAHPTFWESVRSKTLAVDQDVPRINRLIKKYKRLYRDFKTPDIYFLIGYIETGGTTTQTQVLLGTEIIAADSTVNAEGLAPFFRRFFDSNKGIYPLVAHELTHTQQKGGDIQMTSNANLLGFCLAEGSCDFLAELLISDTLNHPYMVYGRQHEKELWEKFRSEMRDKKTADWLYNGGLKGTAVPDLGYYIGYAICKKYYEQAPHKKQAIKKIIALNPEDPSALEQFLAESRYGEQFGSK